MTKYLKTASKSIKNTGERMVPAYHKNQLVYGEHLVRYEAVKELVKGKAVLDIAAGSGYGSYLIARTAKKVTGVDYSPVAAKYAKANYASPKITYLQGDAKAIPIDDNSVDVVVSFETLEHIDDYEKFMSEIKRVLKPNGLLVLSTPNDIEFPEGADFHFHEFKQAELERLVKKYFKNIKPYYQGTWIYNTLLSEQRVREEWSAPVNTLSLAPISLDRILYFFYLCSNRPIKEEVALTGAISEHWSTRKMLEHNASMDKYMRKMKAHYEGILQQKDKQIEQARREGGQPALVRQGRRAGRLVRRKAGALKTKVRQAK